MPDTIHPTIAVKGDETSYGMSGHNTTQIDDAVELAMQIQQYEILLFLQEQLYAEVQRRARNEALTYLEEVSRLNRDGELPDSFEIETLQTKVQRAKKDLENVAEQGLLNLNAKLDNNNGSMDKDDFKRDFDNLSMIYQLLEAVKNALEKLADYFAKVLPKPSAPEEEVVLDRPRGLFGPNGPKQKHSLFSNPMQQDTLESGASQRPPSFVPGVCAQ